MKLVEILQEATINVDITEIKQVILDAVRELFTNGITSNKEDNTEYILDTLNRYLTPYNIEVVLIPAENLDDQHTADQTGIYLGGTYPNGDIALVVSDNISNFLKSPENGVAFLTKAVRTIKHELVHREQVRRADPEYLKKVQRINYSTDEEYISDPIEIMAMAHDVVQELTDWGYSPEQIIDALKTGNSKILNYSDRYVDYVIHSGKDKPAYKRLVKNIIELLKHPQQTSF